MLSDDEAVVVALGAVTAGRLGLSGSAEAVDGALAKIHRVLPDGLRRRVEALETTLAFTSTPHCGCTGRRGHRAPPRRRDPPPEAGQDLRTGRSQERRHAGS